MPAQTCKVFIVDDSIEDRTVIRLMLEETAGRDWEFVEEEKGRPALERLESESPDCILLDYQLPDMDGLRFLNECMRRFGLLRFPIVMLTGSGRTSVAVNALKAGAQDYLSKDLIRSERLVRAVESAIDRTRLLRERDAQQARIEDSLRRLELLEIAVQSATESIVITDSHLDPPGPRIVFANRAFSTMTGYSVEEALGQSPRLLQGPKTDRAVLDRLRHCLEQGKPFSGRVTNYRKDGSEFVQDWSVAPVLGQDGSPTHFVAVQRDVTRAEAYSMGGGSAAHQAALARHEET